MRKFLIQQFLWAVVLSFGFAPVLAQTPAEPKITSVSIQGTNIVVKVAAPAGVRKISVETRSRLDASTWAPKAVKRFDAPTTETQDLTFTLPRSDKLEVLRVRADATEALPAQFFKGTNQFAGPQSSGNMPPGGTAVDTAGPGSAPEMQDRSVVESDIWKVAGDTLYFFNNLRGLQILDISNPAAPAIKTTFGVPASGEEMYVLRTGHAVLLTRNWCNSDGSDESRVLIIDGSAATPTLVAEPTVAGWIVESRMVGSALYLVSQTYYRRTAEGATYWEPRTMLTSLDLSEPSAPVKRNSQLLNGYAQTVYATDRYLFASSYNQTRNGSDIQVIDISSPTGEFSILSMITAGGSIQDKFKLNIDGDTLTAISLSWADTTRWTTTLENYSLADPRAPVKVGALRLAEGEQLHATRFDGKRVYIVTYLRVDPLWIVDLADPAKPRIAGELHVPGWSTYLHPLGDRVLALGIDDTNSWRVAVSLFDVSNTAEPKLLSKIALGETSSWSEANYNEKALTVLESAGLVLVPYQGYTLNGAASHVQLIDLARDSLTQRGQISDHLYPRRATLHRDHIISISGREFISYDAANRDQPALKARIDLAWPVNKILLAGEHLIELEMGENSYGRYYWYGSPSRPTIRVAGANAPETVLTSITLTNPAPIAGAELRDNKLYVAQAQSYNPYPVWILNDATGQPIETNRTPALHMSIWDVSNLPNLTKLSETPAAEVGESFGGSVKALWPKPDLLVWTGGSYFNSWWLAVDVAAPMGLWWPGWGWGGGGSGRFAAFDVADASSPAFKSHIDLTTNGGWNFSKTMVVEGLVYLSHQTSEQIPVDPPPAPTDPTTETTTASGGWGGTNQTFIFVTKYFLDVIDYEDPANPVVRKPVNVPGSLQGASHQGSVIYTLGNHFDAEGHSVGGEWLDASAYDGVSAYLVDSLSVTNWPHPVVVRDGDIFLGGPTALERWQLSAEGMLQKLSTTDTKGPVYDLRFFGDLVGLTSNSRIQLYDASNRGALKLVGESQMACHGAELENADGALGRGLWLPQNEYGVFKIAVTAPAE